MIIVNGVKNILFDAFRCRTFHNNPYNIKKKISYHIKITNETFSIQIFDGKIFFSIVKF